MPRKQCANIRALPLLCLLAVTLAGCGGGAQTSPPAATSPPTLRSLLPTETPPGGALIIFWSVIGSVRTDEDQAIYTLRISASGGQQPYTYYHDGVRLDGANFEVVQPCQPDGATAAFDIAVESADGQRDSMQGALPAGCPPLMSTPVPTPTVPYAPASADLNRPAGDQPAFYALNFAESAGAPSAYIFPNGTARVVARWHYQHIPPGETVHRRLTAAPGRPEPVTARPGPVASYTWDRDSDGQTTFDITPDSGEAAITPGAYTLRLWLESDPYRFVEASFVVLPEIAGPDQPIRLGIEAEGLTQSACLLWQIGAGELPEPRTADGPTGQLTTWGMRHAVTAPGGERTAFVTAYVGSGGGMQELRVYDWAAGAGRLLDVREGAWRALDWSSDGALLAAAHDGGVMVFDAAGDAAGEAAPVEVEGTAYPRFAPGDDRLAFVRDGDTLVVRASSGDERIVTWTGWDSIGGLAWDRGGRWLYYVEQGPPGGGAGYRYVDSVLWVADLTADDDTARWSVNPYVSLRDLQVSPSGRYLLATDGTGAPGAEGCTIDERLHIFDLEADDPTRQVRTLWDLSGGGQSTYTWLDDETFLLSRRPACGGLAVEFVSVDASTGRAVWLGGVPNTPVGPACR